jgi:dipeptidyl aminopeptidase/acylaminoacyl peptidase
MPNSLYGPKPFTPEDAFRLQFIQGARLSPDGRYVAYTVSGYDAGKDADISTLWLLDCDAPEPKPRALTSGEYVDSPPVWSPDGKQLAFLSARNGPPQIYVLNLGGGEARKLTAFKQGVGGGPVWSPDGSWLAFTTGPEPDAGRKPTDPYRVNRITYRFNGFGYLDDVIQDIYIIAAIGGEPRRLTRDGHMNVEPRWSPDSQEILYTTLFTPGKRWEPGLRVVGLTGVKRDIVWAWGTASAAAWLPDGKRIAFTGEPHETLSGTKTDLYVVEPTDEATGRIPEKRTEQIETGVGGGLQGDTPAGLMYATNLLFSPDGASVYMNAQAGGAVHILQIGLNGEPNCIPIIHARERSVTLLGLHADRLIFGQSTHLDPVQLYELNLTTGDERRLTNLNAEVLRKIAAPRVEPIPVSAEDGATVDAWLMIPSTGKAPYPCVTVAHGGPWGAFGYTYSIDFQLLAGAGYAVLFLNYHGSSGYGTAFGTSLQGDWGGPILRDHMAALDAAIAKGLIDPDRLGINGLSAGGYTTCFLVGNTPRFKAAVAENPVTNLASIRLIGDISLDLIARSMGGTPDQVPENYRKSSPITFAHQCTTPTLLIQGEADWRCPAEQSEQFYTTLKVNGCTVEMLRLPNSAHAASILGPPSIRRAQDKALLAWMNQYLR